MDKRTRVLNAMNNLPVDHVPVSFWHHFNGVDLGEDYIQAHVDYYRETDIDFIKVQSTGFFEYPLPKMEKTSDWWKIKPIGADHPWIRGQVERAKGVKERVGDECCVFYTTFAPFSSIRFGSSNEFVMKTLAEDEKALMYALDVIAQDNATLARLLITEAGLEGIYYCVQGGEYDRMDEATYRRVIRPSDLYVLDMCNRYSDNNILHFCGYDAVKNRLSVWKDYPAKAVTWAVSVEELSLFDGRAYFGNRCCMGGFESINMGETGFRGLLFHGSKEEIQTATREMILEYGKRGLMLGADCVVDPNVPSERLNWVVEAARSL